MAISPGYFIFRSACQHQCRLFLIPWMNWSSTINCSKGRGYSDSVPVRYIPKKSSKCKEINAASLPTKHLENQKMHDSSSELNLHRVEFTSNSRRSFVLNPKTLDQEQSSIGKMNCGAELDFGVEEEIESEFGGLHGEFMEEPIDVEEKLKVYHGTDSGKKLLVIKSGKGKQEVENLAIELLATRGLINDSLYAETFSQSRWSSSSWGPGRIKQALLKKGVNEIDVHKAIKLVFEDGEACGDQDSRIGMSKPSIDRLLDQASTQWLRSHGLPLETRKSRIVRWLQYRGFNWNVIGFVLKKLGSGRPS